MPDEIDIANDNAAADLARREHAARLAASQIPAGTPGDCDLCGEWTARLVGGACARCCDHYRIA
jgi:hypothetical protein